MNTGLSPDALRVLCDATVKLTELKLREVPHLCIENFAPKLLEKMIAATKQ